MITTLKGSFENPRKYIISSEWMDEEELMSPKQRHSLINLIFSKIEDKETRERWLSQVDDSLTAIDADDLYFSLLMSSK